MFTLTQNIYMNKKKTKEKTLQSEHELENFKTIAEEMKQTYKVKRINGVIIVVAAASFLSYIY